VGLPEEVLNTPFGRQFAPMLAGFQPGIRSTMDPFGGVPTSAPTTTAPVRLGPTTYPTAQSSRVAAPLPETKKVVAVPKGITHPRDKSILESSIGGLKATANKYSNDFPSGWEPPECLVSQSREINEDEVACIKNILKFHYSISSRGVEDAKILGNLNLQIAGLLRHLFAEIESAKLLGQIASYQLSDFFVASLASASRPIELTMLGTAVVNFTGTVPIEFALKEAILRINVFARKLTKESNASQKRLSAQIFYNLFSRFPEIETDSFACIIESFSTSTKEDETSFVPILVSACNTGSDKLTEAQWIAVRLKVDADRFVDVAGSLSEGQLESTLLRLLG